jgi:Caleosin related protein
MLHYYCNLLCLFDTRTSLGDCYKRATAQRKASDFFGAPGTVLKFGLTFWLAADKDWTLSKECMLGVYDGASHAILHIPHIEEHNVRSLISGTLAIMWAATMMITCQCAVPDRVE